MIQNFLAISNWQLALGNWQLALFVDLSEFSVELRVT